MTNIHNHHSHYSNKGSIKCNCHHHHSNNVLSCVKKYLEKPIFLIISFAFLLLAFVLPILIGHGFLHNHGQQHSPFEYLALFSIAISGYPIFYNCLANIKKGKVLSSSLLISLAIVASMLVLEFFAAAEIAFLMSLGEYLEDLSLKRASKSLNNLYTSLPKTVNTYLDGKIISKDIEKVEIGDSLLIRPGEIVPLDCMIISGNSSLDTSSINGESLAQETNIGQTVYSGSKNLNGSFVAKVINTNDSSTYQNLLKLIDVAEHEKSPIERYMDKISGYLVGLALLIALLAFIISGDIIRAVSVLVVFCPCALVLATPVSVVASISQAAKNAVLIKNRSVLEVLADIKYICFDKTGTISEARLSVVDFKLLNKSYNKDFVLGLSYGLEIFSEHPIAKAIQNYAESEAINPIKVYDFYASTGCGVQAMYNGKKYSLSKPKKNLNINDFNKQYAYVVLYEDTLPLAVFSLSDTIKKEAKNVISDLKKYGLKTVLLSGDRKEVVNSVAKSLNFDEYKAELMPIDKLNYIKDKKDVCMVGDGLNDAPALKNASVSIAMEELGNDLSVDISDIVISGDNLNKIPYLIRLAKACKNNILINISLSLAINIFAVILALMGNINPIVAALIHNLGAIFVIINASMLYRRTI